MNEGITHIDVTCAAVSQNSSALAEADYNRAFLFSVRRPIFQHRDPAPECECVIARFRTDQTKPIDSRAGVVGVEWMEVIQTKSKSLLEKDEDKSDTHYIRPECLGHHHNNGEQY